MSNMEIWNWFPDKISGNQFHQNKMYAFMIGTLD